MRTCVLLIPGLSNRLVDMMAADAMPFWFTELLAAGRVTVRPVLPATTMPVQATYTTGVLPQEHGMVANGVAAFRNKRLREHLDLTSHASYRQNVSFWEQSSALVEAPRTWHAAGSRAAMLFVQSSMDGAADVVVTPKPKHTSDGKTIATCYSDPPELYEKLKKQFGEFPLHHYWGPMAGLKSSEWIVSAGRYVWEEHKCGIQWTYLPQLDYDLQRFGPNDPRCATSLVELLGLLTSLAEKVRADDGQLVVLGEYGMTEVTRSVAPNVLLREAGLLRTSEDGEMDYQASSAFAMCDHQAAHVYGTTAAAIDEAERLLRGLSEVKWIYRGEQRRQVGLDCDRAGDLVVFSHEDAWFEYRWWSNWQEAPAFAWTVDIHAKPGYDPTELFFDPQARRVRADQPQLVKGSHGTLPENEADWPVMVGLAPAAGKIDAVAVADCISGAFAR